MYKPKILIVDDEPKNTRLLKAMLVSENYDILENFNGEQALETVAAINPDLILLDVMMPGIDGFSVCKELKQGEETKIIPIVMVTALSEKEYRIKALEAGADDFLRKPVDRSELVVRVKSLLRIKAYHDELWARNREIAEQNEKLHELEKIKEGLTHMVIHDLNNPLSSIIASLELMLLKEPSLYQNHLGSMTACISYCRELKDMILSLLEIHKLEEGNLEPALESTNITELINDVIEQSDFIAKGNQVLVSASGSQDSCLVAIDRDLIRRVLVNLINNAIRHTPPGGSVDLKTDSHNTNGSVQIRITDTGNGLAPEYHQRVFNKFEQVHLKQEGVKVGASGIGLAFCKMAVEAHGGRIWVESEGEGKGSTFQFSLPVKPTTH
jgi:two-component system, sensor histidine kinase and response regulator